MIIKTTLSLEVVTRTHIKT